MVEGARTKGLVVAHSEAVVAWRPEKTVSSLSLSLRVPRGLLAQCFPEV